MKPCSVRDLEDEARKRLPAAHYDYFAGGADDEVTLRANEAAFARRTLLPRVLRGAKTRELGLRLLDCPASLPLVLSPTAFHRLAHPEGELATARAAAKAGVPMVVSMAATTTLEAIAEVARESGGGTTRLWFQIYLQPDLDHTRALIRRAETAGYRALVVTVDSPVFGRHGRDRRNGFRELPTGLRCENLTTGDGPAVPITFLPDLSWDHIAWLRGETSLPIVLKGILHPEDAELAVKCGAGAIFVSNHGGRQLDTAPATLDLLPSIARAVGGRIPLILDGGIRRGTDIVKALCFGAAAVGIGRPVLWGLATDGEAGVTQVLDLLRAELDETLALCGCRSVKEAGPELVRDAVGKEIPWSP